MSERIWNTEKQEWEWPVREELKAAAFEAMKLLTDDERMEVMWKFCKSCGSDDPDCRCRNDE
jgi:hypothetical protein